MHKFLAPDVGVYGACHYNSNTGRAYKTKVVAMAQ